MSNKVEGWRFLDIIKRHVKTKKVQTAIMAEIDEYMNVHLLKHNATKLLVDDMTKKVVEQNTISPVSVDMIRAHFGLDRIDIH